KDADMRADSSDKSKQLESLKKGDVVELLKLGKWSKVRAPDRIEGYVKREAFARKTIVAGTNDFAYTDNVVDKLRKVPVIDIVAVIGGRSIDPYDRDMEGRMMPT